MAINNISGNNLNQVTNLSNTKTGVAQSNTTVGKTITDSKQNDASVSKPEQDNLTLTESASRLKKLEDSIAHLPIVDTQRVEQIQHSIQDGNYSINADKIAEKLIDMELALSQ